MIPSKLLPAFLAIALCSPSARAQGLEPLPSLYALRVASAETIADGTVPYAVLLVENGKLIAVGQDLPIEAGIPIYDLPDVEATPGLVSCRSRIGLDARGDTGINPEIDVRVEAEKSRFDYSRLLEHGVTTLALYPPGGGIIGQSLAIRPIAGSFEERLLKSPAYLAMTCGANKQAKKYVRDAFALVDKYMEAVAKEREKANKKGSSKAKTTKEEPKEGEKPAEGEAKPEEKKEGEEKKDAFVPPVPDPRTLPLVKLLAGDLRALVGIRKAADYLHFKDAIVGREFAYHLQIDLRDELDLFYIAEDLGKAGEHMVVDPRIVQHPGTRRERNLPAELQRAGVKIAFVPVEDSIAGHGRWLTDVGLLVRFGFDRQAALEGLTLEPAKVLGLEERLGSLEVGKDANLVLWDGDPLAPTSHILAVILEGRLVFGEL
jgi:Amidohydrolase family